MSFEYDEMMDVLKRFNKLKDAKQEKFLKRLLFDDDFVQWLFQPEQVPNLREKVSDFYIAFTKPRVIQVLLDIIDDTNPRKFTRSHTTFFYTVANMIIKANNDTAEEINKQRKEGEISNREAAKANEKLEAFNDMVADLLKAIRRINKVDAKELSRVTRLPKYLCYSALHSVPDYKYIDRYKIGFYLNNLLSSIYSEIEEFGNFERSIKWREFFKEIFGKDNVVEAATFILLEGVHRIDNYRNSEDVRDCWDSLTDFALRELNGAPDGTLSQMIELYIKRIDKMFANNSFDLRVNLLGISEAEFPHLVETVTKYSDKIKDILGRGKDEPKAAM